MKFMTQYPVHSDVDGGAWIKPANITAFAQALEATGFEGLAFTDHPAPSKKWLEGGGHESFDPYAALTFLAAVTSKIRLMTHLAVVPYRNPLLQARSMATLDVLSNGRSLFVLGAGYLRSEFAAMGVEFEDRNALFDEAVEVFREVFTAESFAFKGKTFTSVGQCIMPTVVQRPHPPLWVGGNSGMALERVAKWGQGWSCLWGAAQKAQTSRTATISNEAELAAALDRLKAKLEAHGRTLAEVDIEARSDGGNLTVEMSDQERVDRLGALGRIGVTWTGVQFSQASYSAGRDALLAFAENVAPKLR